LEDSEGNPLQYLGGEDNSDVDGMQIYNAGTTQLITGGLEASTTDLATEITEMITTQRGYQANTRIVTVTDDMLEELVNMKR
jgi:flagellar hook protein FlgE